MSNDPIEEARRLLAELDGEWEYKKGRDHWDVHSKKKRGSAWVAEVFDKRDADLIAAAPRLLQALLDRLEAAERLIESCAAHFDRGHRSDDEMRQGSRCVWAREAAAYIEANDL